ncbi:hypothetical protein MtrunA17_Chr3g0092951 [Medicago truncatula]|uniref:Uncharacterized protein n=1 Tax=Medicago truncatula TaxID=3880 RepID=A0A396ILV0_MEDTR|nr:hypothetical protein MtrunA17_Chr3g0092951 [Medicago truncatula]
MSRSQTHLSETFGTNKTSNSKALHSSNISSSHAHNLRRHLHPSPCRARPSEKKLATVIVLFSAKSNNRRNRTLSRIPPIHLCDQKKVSAPSPTFRITL